MKNLGTLLLEQMKEEAQAPAQAGHERANVLVVRRFFIDAKRYFTRALEVRWPSSDIFMQLGGETFYYENRDGLDPRPHPQRYVHVARLLSDYRNGFEFGPSGLGPQGPYGSIWTDFEHWAAGAGLVPCWQFGHDEASGKSWWQLRIKPAPAVTGGSS